ncbi:MAG: hypothetical protein ACLP3R_24710 [Candidatus Korobacteraceae bacterium]
MARISPIGCRIEHNVQEREVRELVTKGQVQDFQTKIIVIGIQKSGGIFFEFIEAVCFQISRVETAQEVGEAYACNQRRKIRVSSISIGGQAYFYVFAERSDVVAEKLSCK